MRGSWLQHLQERLSVPEYRLRTYRPNVGFEFRMLRASDPASARRTLEQSGFKVVDVQLLKPTGSFRKWREGSAFSLELFAEELLTLLDAGLNLVEAVELVARKQRNLKAREVLEQLQKELGRGLSLSAALECNPEVFPVLFVATVRASERTGDLGESLRRYLAYRRQINAVRDKAIAASLYPALLILISSAMLVFLMAFVVPRFAVLYEDLGDRVPLASKLMVEWSQLVSDHGGSILVVLLTGICALTVFVSRPTVRAALVRRLWRLPGVGERIRVYQLARFTRTLAMLHDGGIAFVPALGMVGDLLHQPALKDGLEKARKAVAEGASVAVAFEAHGLSTETAARMLAVGERSGELGRMLAKIAEMYDQEVARTVDWFSRLLEPVLMIIVGLVIGTVILLMYLPIVELANLVQ